MAGERAKPASEPHVYRLDFVLSGKDGGSGAPNTSFTLNLEENRAGEVMIGKNVALVAATPTGSAPPPVSPRQDVGLKVKVIYRTVGEDVLLEVTTEMSALEAPTTIRKVLARSSALARPGKATLVVSLEDDHKRYDLSVTPTKLR